VHDNVRTELNRLDDVSSSTEGVIDNEGNAMVVCDLRESGDVVDDVLGVRDRLDKDGLGALVNGSSECLGGRLGDPLHTDAELLEGDFELVVGTAIKVGGRDDVVSGASNRGNGEELGGLTRGGGDGGDTALELGNALLEDVDGRVTDTGVDVSMSSIETLVCNLFGEQASYQGPRRTSNRIDQLRADKEIRVSIIVPAWPCCNSQLNREKRSS